VHTSAQKKDASAQKAKTDSLRFPLLDRRSDRFTTRNNNPFDLIDTSFIKQTIEYDPVTKQYIIIEKIGDKYYRTPTYLTFDELMRLQAKADEDQYFQDRANALFDLNRKVKRPKPRMYDKLFDRIFGVGPNGMKVDIKPQGSVDITMGYQGQKVDNPTLPERARNNGGFDFNMNANVQVTGNIGDKLKLPINYNTLANFDYENQLKLDYKGMDDEIIKSIEAGNINFQTKGTLMSSPQSLFGIKTQLQFGKLFVTAALANQRSQQQSVTLQGSGVTQTINKKLDDYEENKDFLLAQYFHTNYNKAMSNLPIVNSQVQILRMEVWVTNRTGVTTNTRTVVGLMDLAENNPYNTNIHSLTTNTLPQNGANDLYSFLTSNQANRNPALVTSLLQGKGLQPVNDFEKTFARQLSSSEYYFNPQVGFIILNQQLQPNDVLAVAYQYTYNGHVYQVGEFSQDVALDSTQGVQKVLFLKLLKATAQRTDLPLWKLMMKNVYSLDVVGMQKQSFNINILYQEPSGGTKRYLPEAASNVSGQSLISILNADKLNTRNDPIPDGIYDFVDSFTVLSQQGKIIFPLLEPFGHDLDSLAYNGMSQEIKDKYLFNQLYDSIKAIAQTYANVDRFVAQGTIKGNSTSEISLGGFNIPQGSVKVTAGGQPLQENVDYIIDYNLGTLKVINQSIINSGIPVNVQFENTASYGLQQRTFMGLRLDYKVNKKLSLGGTIERLSERPYFTKVNYGEDPINNTMFGGDFSYHSDLPGLTRLLDKLPFYHTTTMSHINAYGEAAFLKPGHAPQIGKGSSGAVYIDDFEGSNSYVDMRYPFVSWALASTPQGNGLFPEGGLNDSLPYGYNRSKLAWYTIEPILQDKTSADNPLRNNTKELSDPRVRAVYTNELFPNKTTNITDVLLPTFDLAYYPTDLGPYNYVYNSSDINANGKLLNPKQRWGGIMRSIDQTDFVTGNVEYIEFWMQDPFILNPASSGGKLYIDLGNVSEDILKDGRRFYENGLNTPSIPSAVDSSGTWGTTPINPIQVTQAFSNDPNDRPYQDVGFDGLDDNGERRKRSQYLQRIATNFSTGSAVYQKAVSDPSHDDYKWYRDAGYDASNTGILGRYKEYNGPQGNSPIVTGNSKFSPAATLYPDNEDLDHDNTLNESEQYYEYEVDLKPGMSVGLTKYITDSKVVTPVLADGTTRSENWYLFRVPIEDFTNNVGNLPDFKSIRFMRMYLTGFEDSVVMRFASLNLVRNQWRSFTYKLDTTGSYTPLPSGTSTTLNVTSVNIEQNSSREPIPYVIPPGIERVQYLSNNGVNLLQNEQSMSLQLYNLAKGDARAVFKTMNLDMRQYGNLSMFIHAESVIGQTPVQDGQLNAVIRIGQDFLSNYYEIKIPLKMTPFGSTNADTIWPSVNQLSVILNDLVQLKTQRNAANFPVDTIYRQPYGTNNIISVLGNPNIGQVQGMLIAVENASGQTLNTEVWVDELRLSNINENGGWAALGRVDMQLADLGTVSLSANTYTHGFGGIEQNTAQRALNDMLQMDAALNIDAGKLLPKKAGISMPVYAGIDRTVFTPLYDPYNLDVKYKDELKKVANKDSLRSAALNQSTTKTLNFTNVRFGQNGKRPHFWSISNFDFSFSYTHIQQSDSATQSNLLTRQSGSIGYTFNGNSKFKQPFKKMIRNKSEWFALIRDFNINFTPSLVGLRVNVNRQYEEYIPRIVNLGQTKIDMVDTTYNKYFTMDRLYNLRWDLTRSINIDFSATNSSVIDEPYGRINTKAKKDSLWHNFFKGGRNTLYQQHAAVSYSLPLAKLPLTDWITARYTYSTTYNWIAASLLATSFGNTLENSSQSNINTQLDFTRLYAKSRFLNAVNTPTVNNSPQQNNSSIPDSLRNIKTRDEVVKGLKGKARKEALRKWRAQKRALRKAEREAKKKQPEDINPVVKTAGQLLTMIKQVRMDYSTIYDSRVPGYMDSSKYLGQNWQSHQPGFDYIFGKQPDTAWLNKKAQQGVITHDTTFNLLFTQDYSQHLSFAAQLQPIRDFMVDINIDKTFSKQYSELFKDTTGQGAFGHLSPYASGGFSVSYISYKTLFTKFNPNQVSETFNLFQSYRSTISSRLAKQNPYYTNGTTPDGYAAGYGRYAQDVLIPAFIAAYTGKDPNSVPLIKQSNPNVQSNPFSGIKALPNWHVTYTGLSKIPSLAATFSNISITHGYNATFSMNSFTSALLFSDPQHYGAPSFIDTISGNYVPYFLVPNLTMQEQFSPLIGIDVTTTKQANFHFEYKKGRQLSLSLIDYQVSETRSTGWSFGAGYRLRDINLPFKMPFSDDNSKRAPGQKKVHNDMNLQLTLSTQDNQQSNSVLDQANAYSTGGQRIITINPTIDYVLNSRVNLRFYFTQQRIRPYVSTTAPITNTSGGLEIRISLAPKQ
jgi:cell surface protein SprA